MRWAGVFSSDEEYDDDDECEEEDEDSGVERAGDDEEGVRDRAEQPGWNDGNSEKQGGENNNKHCHKVD